MTSAPPTFRIQQSHAILAGVGLAIFFVVAMAASFAVGRVTKQSAMDRMIEEAQQRHAEEREAERKRMAEPFDLAAFRKQENDKVLRSNAAADAAYKNRQPQSSERRTAP